MTKNKATLTYRVADLIKKSGYSVGEFADNVGLSASAIKSYLQGENDIPRNTIVEWAEKFDFSIDWFLNRRDFMDERDVMADVVFALSRIMQVKVVAHLEETSDGTIERSEALLCIDRRFYDFLTDIRDLEQLLSGSAIITPETYNAIRKQIYKKHRNSIREIFERDEFNESNELHIHSADDISVIDLL